MTIHLQGVEFAAYGGAIVGRPHDPPSPPAPPTPDPTPPPPPPSPPPGCSFLDYALGDPLAGFVSDRTSTQWQRQYSNPSADAAVHFTGAEILAGWSEIQCTLHASDPGWPDPTHSGARAQIIRSIDFSTLGAEAWFSFPFRLDPSYVPQSSSSWPNWNQIMSLHDFHISGGSYVWAPQAPVNLSVATRNQNTGEAFASPRFEFGVYGGDVYNPNWWSNGHRYYTPFGVNPGHTWIVDLYVLLSPSGGRFSAWLDGVEIVPLTTMPTTWQWTDGISGLYAVEENYRPSNNLLISAGQPTWSGTPTIYYGGFRKGNTRECTTLFV